MNALFPTFQNENGIGWTETHDGYWTVVVDGDAVNTRAITKAGSSFIAWIGHQDRHWCFERALKACAANVRLQCAMADEAERAREEAIASLMRMTPEQKARAIDRLEAERDALDYSDAHVDVVARKAIIDTKINRLRQIGSAA